jgi:hypothetical protein
MAFLGGGALLPNDFTHAPLLCGIKTKQEVLLGLQLDGGYTRLLY